MVGVYNALRTRKSKTKCRGTWHFISVCTVYIQGQNSFFRVYLKILSCDTSNIDRPSSDFIISNCTGNYIGLKRRISYCSCTDPVPISN